mmetsp:Transcript_47349/g.75895  ORF Transcript_47349/g.75895 Transcript_47349/m.75895 type:complete len:203 (-) Transcript_47349:103-711(-)
MMDVVVHFADIVEIAVRHSPHLRRLVVLIEQHMQSELGLQSLQSLIAESARRSVHNQLHQEAQVLHKLSKRMHVKQRLIRPHKFVEILFREICFIAIAISLCLVVVVAVAALLQFACFAQLEHPKHAVLAFEDMVGFLGQRVLYNVDVEADIFVINQARRIMAVLVFVDPSLSHHARRLQFATYVAYFRCVPILLLALDPNP